MTGSVLLMFDWQPDASVQRSASEIAEARGRKPEEVFMRGSLSGVRLRLDARREESSVRGKTATADPNRSHALHPV
jgi:hypothetical protein